LSDRSGFEETARYWAEIYAGAPATSKLSTSTGAGADATAATGVEADEKKAKAGKKKAPVVDEVAAAGLNAAHVQQFESLGFERKKVVRTVHPSLTHSLTHSRFVDRSPQEAKLQRR
jgi:ubiquitin-conjugating enzyme (huntingtin interacting protein 2)